MTTTTVARSRTPHSAFDEALMHHACMDLKLNRLCQSGQSSWIPLVEVNAVGKKGVGKNKNFVKKQKPVAPTNQTLPCTDVDILNM